jgi:hypothetical protein
MRTSGPRLRDVLLGSRSVALSMTRRAITIVKRSLGESSDAATSGTLTSAERLALVDTLTREAWTLAGYEWPSYARADTPIAVRSLRDLGDLESLGEDPRGS